MAMRNATMEAGRLEGWLQNRACQIRSAADAFFQNLRTLQLWSTAGTLKVAR